MWLLVDPGKRARLSLIAVLMAISGCCACGESDNPNSDPASACDEIDCSDSNPDLSPICDNTAIAPTPFCDIGCTSSCGCASCDYQTSRCGSENDASFMYHCNPDRGCFERSFCSAGGLCAPDYSGHSVLCYEPSVVNGSTLGVAQGVKLRLQVGNAGMVADWHEEIIVVSSSGLFASRPYPRGYSYALYLSEPIPGCSISHASGIIGGPESSLVTIVCGTPTPCDLAGYSCFPSTSSCPYAYYIFDWGTAPRTEIAALSCAADAAPTSDTLCCRLAP